VADHADWRKVWKYLWAEARSALKSLSGLAGILLGVFGASDVGVASWLLSQSTSRRTVRRLPGGGRLVTVVVTHHWPLAVALAALLVFVLVATVVWRLSNAAVLERAAHAETRAELHAATATALGARSGDPSPTYQFQVIINADTFFMGGPQGASQPEAGSPGPGGTSDPEVESRLPNDQDGGRET
jgi:hypothetical protein